MSELFYTNKRALPCLGVQELKYQKYHSVPLDFICNFSMLVGLGLGMGKNISIHQCIAIYFFPIQYRFIKSSESIRASDHLLSLAGPLSPRLKQLKAFARDLSQGSEGDAP